MFIKGYHGFSLSKAGIGTCADQGPGLGARFTLDTDVSPLFPYINSVLEGSRYYEKPDYIQFVLEGVLCTLYPRDVLCAPFSHEDQARGFADSLIDFLNDLYAKKDILKPNYKRYKPVTVLDVLKLLPLSNCGKCGYSTCMAFAAALRLRETSPGACPEFSEPIEKKAVYPVLDRNGNVAATFELDIDFEKRGLQEKNLETDDADSETKHAQTQVGLTDRELEVLRLVAEGATNLEISDLLSISPHTVKSHVIHIFNKLGVNDRTQAAVQAIQRRIL